jgi:adenylosuccinate synthase
MKNFADVIVGLQSGDEGKGKITHHLLKDNQEGYTHVLRFNGGGNAGHTIYHEGKKFVTHHIPSGVFYNITSVIGSGCVIDPVRLKMEIEELNENGVAVDHTNLKIAKNAHIVREGHILQESNESTIGTTKRGIGPAYVDKYARKGLRAEKAVFMPEYSWMMPYIVDLYEELHLNDNPTRVLCEGAQGFGLDIDFGDYPYVTSSPCVSGAVTLNAIPPHWVRKVYGIAKPYVTYVGAKNVQDPNDPVLNDLQVKGNEVGATTGRKRQVTYLSSEDLMRSIVINGVTDLIVNKMDIFEEVMESHNMIYKVKDLKIKLGTLLARTDSSINRITYSYSPHHL